MYMLFACIFVCMCVYMQRTNDDDTKFYKEVGRRQQPDAWWRGRQKFAHKSVLCVCVTCGMISGIREWRALLVLNQKTINLFINNV